MIFSLISYLHLDYLSNVDSRESKTVSKKIGLMKEIFAGILWKEWEKDVSPTHIKA